MLTNDTPINNGQTFTSAILTVPRSDIGYKIVGSVFTDKAGTIYIEQDYDKSKILSDAFDVSSSYSVTANDGSGFSEDIVAPYIRIRFSNTSGSNQNKFKLRANFIRQE